MKKTMLWLMAILTLLGMNHLALAEELELPTAPEEALTLAAEPEEVPPEMTFVAETEPQAEAEPEIAAEAEPEIEAEPENEIETETEVELENPVEDIETETETEIEPEAIAFTGWVTVQVENMGDIIEGDTVRVKATVHEANMETVVRWERHDPSEDRPNETPVWKTIASGTEWHFEATLALNGLELRPVLVAADGTEVIGSVFRITVLEKSLEEPEQTEVENEAETTDIPDEPEKQTEVLTDEDATSAQEELTEEPSAEQEADEEPSTEQDTDEEPSAEQEADEEPSTDKEMTEEPSAEQEADEEPSTETETEETDDLIEIDDYDTPLGLEPAAPVEKVIRIFSDRRAVMTEGELVTLSSEIEGFDGYEIRYQWLCDRHDGQGLCQVSGANDATYTFTATAETLSWDWSLTVYYR